MERSGPLINPKVKHNENFMGREMDICDPYQPRSPLSHLPYPPRIHASSYKGYIRVIARYPKIPILGYNRMISELHCIGGGAFVTKGMSKLQKDG